MIAWPYYLSLIVMVIALTRDRIDSKHIGSYPL